MDKMLYLNNLYDYYQNLLTEKQRLYFEEYYFNNLSLGEIAENYNVSRNAVFNQLKIAEKRLNEYENILQLYQKKNKIISIIGNKLEEKELKEIEELL
ncbi:MAG: YlxM family DNA-binding protein [Bacilli bacterium]